MVLRVLRGSYGNRARRGNSVQASGVSPETCAHLGAGFAPKGMMRGRFAIPIDERAGALLAYRGRAVKDESPSPIFPDGRDPLHALAAHESGIENVVAFLAENVTALQLEQLAALMDERKCENLEMF